MFLVTVFSCLSCPQGCLADLNILTFCSLRVSFLSHRPHATQGARLKRPCPWCLEVGCPSHSHCCKSLPPETLPRSACAPLPRSGAPGQHRCLSASGGRPLRAFHRAFHRAESPTPRSRGPARPRFTSSAGRLLHTRVEPPVCVLRGKLLEHRR